MIIYGLEDLLWRDQQGGHFPNGHFKVHLGELEESIHRKIISHVCLNIHTGHDQLLPPTRSCIRPYLLKKRGMRTLDPRLGVDPKLAGPACWRGTEMCGFIFFFSCLSSFRSPRSELVRLVKNRGSWRHGGSAYGVTRRRVGPLCHRWDHVGVSVELTTPEAERGSIQRLG